MELFRILGTIAVNNSDANRAIDDTTERVSDSESKLSSAMGKIGSVAAKAAKVIATVSIAAATGIAAITKSAVENYAEYEQLVGGSELMFGEAYDYIAEKAANAYSTVQLSQNEYLTQVNGFAVGLKTALGGNEQAAAELADKIITAEADIVAATGNSQEAVQSAFNGIMKSNYTMLDNLGLGITPTKEGMQEVIDKVNEWNAANGNATSYMIDNLADCEAALVDYVEMQGLAGYASEEAAGTLQGSLASVKGAWENLLTGIADKDADLSQLVQNVAESAKNAFGNLLPVIMQSLSSISQLVAEIAPMIVAELPGLIDTVLPALLGAVTNLIGSALEVLPDLLQTIAAQIPVFVNDMVGMLEANAPLLVEAAFVMVTTLANGIADSLPTLIPAAINIILSIIQTVIDNIGGLIDAALAIITGLATGILDALPILIDKVPDIIVSIVNTLIENLPKIILASIEIINALTLGILENLPTVIAAIIRLMADVVQTLIDHLPEMINSGMQIIVTLADGLIQSIPYLISAIPDLLSALAEAFLDYDFGSIGSNIISGIASGVREAGSTLISAISSAAESALNTAKKKLGIHSPSSVFRDEVGKMLDLGMAEGITENKKTVMDAVDSISDVTTNALNLDLSTNIIPATSLNIHDFIPKTSIFDINDRKLMGGTGSETMSQIEMIQGAVESQNQQLILVLKQILNALISHDETLLDKMVTALESMRFEIREREFARLVREVKEA